MLRTLIVLPDGSELFSGAGTQNAIQSVTITETVNAGQELKLGSCCANMIEARLLTPGGGLSLTAGDELEVYRVADDGARCKVGLFTTEKPTRPTANTMHITAYDRVSWLDKDMTQWLAQQDAWPYNLQELAAMVCARCGLVLKNEEIPNGDYQVQKFSAEGITGRQLMQWIGEIAGRFCRATPEGALEFAWYTPAEVSLSATGERAVDVTFTEGDLHIREERAAVTEDREGICVEYAYLQAAHDGQGNVVLTLNDRQYYFQNTLSFDDYVTAPIQKVQLRQSEEDVGTVYPDGITDPVNTYIITGNPLLETTDAQARKPVAQNLYEHLKSVSYTPCTVATPVVMAVGAGNILQITDRNGRHITAYVMTRRQQGQRDTLECTGSFKRADTTAVNNQSYQALRGKVMNLRTDVDGLFAQNKDTTGKVSQLLLDVEGITGQVSGQSADITGVKEELTAVKQTAGEIKISVEKIAGEGATKIKTGMGYTFDDNGLQIARKGQQMKNLLDNTGMYVTRSGQTILQANDKGVEAADVTVRNYLIVGDHARFEDYAAGRTACFWLEG